MSMPHSSYIGRHAELYDLFYAEKPYTEEARFIHKCFQTYSQRSVEHILELACGTGNHAFALEQFGYEILATDYSPDMLAEANHKAGKINSHVRFRQQDMRALNLEERPFDAAYCLFDSIGYVGSNENIMKVLKGIYSHLRKDGLFIFEFWHAGAMISGFEPLRIRRWEVPEGEILRISETKIDHSTQTCSVKYSIYEMNNNGTFDYTEETQINRFFLVQEMSYYLESAGLLPIEWFSGFQEIREINEETWHILAVTRKKE